MTFTPEYRRVELGQKARDYALVIPVLNEGERLHSLLSRMRARSLDRELDIIIADGGSIDGSVGEALLKSMGVNTILTRISPGRLGTQLQCAYNFCLERGYRGVVTIDGNDKDDPEAVQRFVARLEGGADFVQGSRFVDGGRHENTPTVRLLAVRFIHAPILSWASGFKWTDTTQGFRAYSRKLLTTLEKYLATEELSDYSLLFVLTVVAPKAGLRCEELGTSRVYPRSGPTPTKISGIRGNYRVLQQLLRATRFRRDFRN